MGKTFTWKLKKTLMSDSVMIQPNYSTTLQEFYQWQLTVLKSLFLSIQDIQSHLGGLNTFY
jgi:hypothetical protein